MAIKFRGLSWKLVLKDDGTLHVEARCPGTSLPCGIVMFDTEGVMHLRTGIEFENAPEVDAAFPLGSDFTVAMGDNI